MDAKEVNMTTQRASPRPPGLPWAPLRQLVRPHQMARPQRKSRGSGEELVLPAQLRIQWLTYEVVTEKLHDECRILVAFLGEGVEFFGQR